MGAFGGLILTNRGKILQSKAQAGVTLEYTRIAIGDGQLGTTPILDLNSLRHEVKSLPISKLKVLSGGKAVIGTVWSNSNLTEGFYFREIGVFARDPDLGEILYCYANSGNLAEYIPPGGGSDLIERSLDIQTLVGNATNVTAVIDSSLVYATKPDLDALENSLTQQIAILDNNIGTVSEALSTHQADETAHITDEERTAWNGKYTKPVSGIPKSDLEQDISFGIWEKIVDVTIDSDLAQIDIVGLNEYRTIKVIANLHADTSRAAYMRFNDDSSANYNDGSGAVSSSISHLFLVESSANIFFSQFEFLINNLTATKAKSVMKFANASGNTTLAVVGGRWNNTTALIDKISLSLASSSVFKVGSNVVVLGMK